MDQVLQFYDSMASDYHLIFKDWDAAITYNGTSLDQIIRGEMKTDQPLTVYDCACGIGTQALGLALLGYQVHATDLSPQAVERAKRESEQRNLSMTFGVADFRELREQVERTFDVVIACDNALPHLLTDDDLKAAAENFYEMLNPGGLALLSIRDYDAVLAEKPTQMPLRVHGDGAERRMSFQVWDWYEDAPVYTLNQFIVKQSAPGAWETVCFKADYRALQRAELTLFLQDAGFVNVEWLLPDDSGYYQPVVVARRPAD